MNIVKTLQLSLSLRDRHMSNLHFDCIHILFLIYILWQVEMEFRGHREKEDGARAMRKVKLNFVALLVVVVGVVIF